ncbi:MAG: hypothetical protein ACD_43C00034G0002 [uncultured bacterium]|nr:MAG: hypothetical protein ACD_43C00034G0002 [uncultured bacterium]
MNKTPIVKEPIKAKKGLRSGRLTIAMHNLAYICVGLAIILAVAQFWLYGLRYRRVFSPNVWSSVTLTNGQAYFGHLEQYGPSTVVLFDAYYLQTVPASAEDTTADTTVTNSDTNTDSANITATADETTDSGLQLMSIANDLHKPYNYLIINRDQIMFWQQLTAESPIVQTLESQK